MKGRNKWSAREYRAYLLPLEADTTAMNEAHGRIATPEGGFEIGCYGRDYVARRERVQIEKVFDG